MSLEPESYLDLEGTQRNGLDPKIEGLRAIVEGTLEVQVLYIRVLFKRCLTSSNPEGNWSLGERPLGTEGNCSELCFCLEAFYTPAACMAL